MIKKITIFFILLMLLPAICFAFQGQCLRVADGDTITVLTASKVQKKIRLYGIDCPEKRQAFGQKAKRFALDMTAGKHVKVDAIDTDLYGRTVGIVYIGRMCLNTELLKHGYAWHYNRYCNKSFCDKWKELEQQARTKRIGLWIDPDPTPPWSFRKGKRVKSKAVAMPGQYHGNVKSHKFHRPSCKHFNCKSCTRIFKSREEAVKAGFTPCGLCKP